MPVRSARIRRRLSLTPLVDVIFLLLLFFMLSSTFTPFAEIELAATGGGSAAPDSPPLFLQLRADALSLNGRAVSLDTLAAEAASRAPEGAALLVSPDAAVSAQRLTDILVALGRVDGLAVTVLGR